MDIDEEFQDIDIEKRLHEVESNVNYLLSQISGKSKLVQLIEVLQKDNEELSLRCGKLIREKAELSEVLASKNSIIERMRVMIFSQERTGTLFPRLTRISGLLYDADSLVSTLISDFRID